MFGKASTVAGPGRMVQGNVWQPYGDCPWPTPQVTDVICSWKTDKREWNGAGKSDFRSGNNTKVLSPVPASTHPHQCSTTCCSIHRNNSSSFCGVCIDGRERASLHILGPAQDHAFCSGGFADHNGRATRCGKLQGLHLTAFVHLFLNLHA